MLWRNLNDFISHQSTLYRTLFMNLHFIGMYQKLNEKVNTFLIKIDVNDTYDVSKCKYERRVING